MRRVVGVLLLAPLLGACEHVRGSVAGSCPVFERPPYAVKGATAYDQRVADGFVESGVAGCGWARPAKRPAELDAPRSVKPAKNAPAKKVSARKRLVDRARENLWPSAAAPIVPSPAPRPVQVAPEPPPAPAPATRAPSALERLLGGAR